MGVLNELQAKGIRVLIHSGRYSDLSKSQLASVGLQTEDEGGILFNITGGNHGDKVTQIAEHLKAAEIDDPLELLVVGDTQDDIDAAIRNGARALRIKRPAR